jgi:hypothetical protein
MIEKPTNYERNGPVDAVQSGTQLIKQLRHALIDFCLGLRGTDRLAAFLLHRRMI